MGCDFELDILEANIDTSSPIHLAVSVSLQVSSLTQTDSKSEADTVLYNLW